MKNIYTCITESLCCTPETNTILSWLSLVLHFDSVCGHPSDLPTFGQTRPDKPQNDAYGRRCVCEKTSSQQGCSDRGLVRGRGTNTSRRVSAQQIAARTIAGGVACTLLPVSCLVRVMVTHAGLCPLLQFSLCPL